MQGMGGKVHEKQKHVIVSVTHKQLKYKFKKRNICRVKGIGFTEMLPRDNGKKRKCLKPRIEQVWKVGKVSRFCGPFGYIEGQFGIDG